MLVYRYAPVRSRVPPFWSACPASSVGPAEAAPAPSSWPPGRRRRRDPAAPRQARVGHIGPESFIYHFAIKALYPLI